MKLFKRKYKPSKEEIIAKAMKALAGNTYMIGGNPVVWYNYSPIDFIREGYSKNAEVFSIIGKITDKANVAEPYIYIDKDGQKSRHYHNVTRKYRATPIGNAKHRLQVRKDLSFADENTDLVKLLKHPNERHTWRDLMTLVRIFYFIQGEAFLYREAGDDNCAQSIHIAPPHLMKSVIDNGELVGFEFDMLDNNTRRFAVDEVFHLKRPNPNFDGSWQQFRGFSPLLAGLKYLQLSDKSLESWIKSVENEGAKGLISPSHANPELWLTEDQVKEAQKMVQEKIHGGDNKNKIVVSGMPLQYTHIGLSPDALNVINGLDKAQIKLNDLWGVPAVLFDANPTYQNQQAGAKRFLTEVVIPYLNIDEDKLNQWLVKPFAVRDNKEYILDYDTSMFEELRMSIDQTDALLKTHSINEIRVMLGSDELEEDYANQVFIQSGLTPLSDYTAGDEFIN